MGNFAIGGRTLGGRRFRNGRTEKEARADARWKRAIFSVPPETHMERIRRQVDGMGTQAREVARAESTSTRFDGNSFYSSGGNSAGSAERCAVRNYFGCGHAASAWGCLQVGRNDGASAEPANF